MTAVSLLHLRPVNHCPKSLEQLGANPGQTWGMTDPMHGGEKPPLRGLSPLLRSCFYLGRETWGS